jgi:hypothetical protein
MAAAGGLSFAQRLGASPTPTVVIDGAFWAGMLCAAWAGIRTLDQGLLSDQSRRLVTLGVAGAVVARYHLVLSTLDVGRGLLIAVAAVGPWLDVAPAASVLVVVPGFFAAMLGVAAHVLAGEALDEGRNEGLKRALGGKFGAAEAAPILYSGGGALAGAGVGAVLISASLKDLLGGGPAGPFWAILGGHVLVSLWAVRRAIVTYRRSFHAVVPRILEVAAPLSGAVGERPRQTPTAKAARAVGDLVGSVGSVGLVGAVAWRDALQVRRAHRLDLPVRGILIAALLLAPAVVLSIPAVAAAWAAVVALVLPTAARASRPALAPRWLERALGLPTTGALLVALVWDLPVVVAIGWSFGTLAALASFGAGGLVHGGLQAAERLR